MLALTMMEQSTDVDRFRFRPIGRHKRTRAGRVLACVAINDERLGTNATAAAAADVVIVSSKWTRGCICDGQKLFFSVLSYLCYSLFISLWLDK